MYFPFYSFTSGQNSMPLILCDRHVHQCKAAKINTHTHVSMTYPCLISYSINTNFGLAFHSAWKRTCIVPADWLQACMHPSGEAAVHVVGKT